MPRRREPVSHEAGGRRCGGGWIVDGIEQALFRQREEQRARRAVSRRLANQQLARQAHLDKMRAAAAASRMQPEEPAIPRLRIGADEPPTGGGGIGPREQTVATGEELLGLGPRSASQIALPPMARQGHRGRPAAPGARGRGSPMRRHQDDEALPDAAVALASAVAAMLAEDVHTSRLRAELRLDKVVKPAEQFRSDSKHFRSAVRDTVVRHIRGRATLEDLSAEGVAKLRRLGIDPSVLETANLTAVEDVTVADVRFRTLSDPPIEVDIAGAMTAVAECVSIADEGDRNDFKERFMSPEIVAYVRIVFWFVFVAFFQKADLPLFEELLDGETPAQLRLFWRAATGRRRARFWEMYHFGVAHAVCMAHVAAFRGSQRCFTENWVNRVYVLAALLLTGVMHTVESCTAARHRLFRHKKLRSAVAPAAAAAAAAQQRSGGEHDGAAASQPGDEGSQEVQQGGKEAEDSRSEPQSEGQGAAGQHAKRQQAALRRRSGAPPPLAPDGQPLPVHSRTDSRPREVVLSHPDPWVAYEVGVYLAKGSLLDGVGHADAAIETVQRNLNYNLRKERFRFGRFPVDLNLSQFDADFNIFNSNIMDYEHAMSRYQAQRQRERATTAPGPEKPGAGDGSGGGAARRFTEFEYIRLNDITGGQPSEVPRALMLPTAAVSSPRHAAASAASAACANSEASRGGSPAGRSRPADEGRGGEPQSPRCDPYALQLCVARVRGGTTGFGTSVASRASQGAASPAALSPATALSGAAQAAPPPAPAPAPAPAPSRPPSRQAAIDPQQALQQSQSGLTSPPCSVAGSLRGFARRRNADPPAAACFAATCSIAVVAAQVCYEIAMALSEVLEEAGADGDEDLVRERTRMAEAIVAAAAAARRQPLPPAPAPAPGEPPPLSGRRALDRRALCTPPPQPSAAADPLGASAARRAPGLPLPAGVAPLQPSSLARSPTASGARSPVSRLRSSAAASVPGGPFESATARIARADAKRSQFRRGAAGVVTMQTHLYHVSPLVAGTVGRPLEFRVSKRWATKTLTFGDESSDLRGEVRRIRADYNAAAARMMQRETAWRNSLTKRRNQLEQDIDRIDRAVNETRNDVYERSELCDAIVEEHLGQAGRSQDFRRFVQADNLDAFRGTLFADNAAAMAQSVDKSLRKLERRLATVSGGQRAN